MDRRSSRPNGILEKICFRDLTKGIIAVFILGYIMQVFFPDMTDKLSLNFDMVSRGEVWRIFSWIILAPTKFDLLTFLMLYFFASIGKVLELRWGYVRYNLYVFGGLFIMVLAGLLSYLLLIYVPSVGEFISGDGASAGYIVSYFVRTYPLILSMMLAYAVEFPNEKLLIWFIIPVSFKVIAIFYSLYLCYVVITDLMRCLGGEMYYLIDLIMMLASFANFLVFFFIYRKKRHLKLTPEQTQMRKEFRENMKEVMRENAVMKSRHRCEICGRTELDDPDLEFRFCSSCEGSHEYCMDHLKNHEHIKEDH